MMDAKKKKVMLKMLIIMGILFGIIFGYKMVVGLFMARSMAANKFPAVVVSATKIQYQTWQPELKAIGSLRAVRGVNVTTELAGMVRSIYFKPGADVKQGDLLVELNIDTDIALLHSLEAQAELAAINYMRDKAQFAVKAVSKAVVDTDAANLQSAQAQVEQQAATLAKKVIRAPFTGRLGVSLVNPGQYINPGDTMVNLQALDPIYVDFYLPQQQISQIAVQQSVKLTVDTYPGQTFSGKITTIQPAVDTATRNIQVEATLANPHYRLLPGMFARVTLAVGKPINYLTLPQTAISFNPYGEIVYIVKQTGKNKQGQPQLTVTQQFVTVGDTRGDQIAVLSGLREGDQVVTSGQLKLKNGSPVTINNQIVPNSSPAPAVTEK